jgi:hypothetical protein
MFRPEEIDARLRQQQFEPFTIVTTEGLRYFIDHPELVSVGHRYITVLFMDPAVLGVFRQEVRVALVHIVALEEQGQLLNQP